MGENPSFGDFVITNNNSARVLIQMGPGGVGKTSVSAAFGLHLAKQGKRVLVMTIDPSKRLAQALGVSSESGIKKVSTEDFKGELYACILDHGKIFDSFIKKIAFNNPAIEKLFNNKLYQALKTQLQGSQDFTSLIELHNQANSGQFDIVILDTPPAQHAWQFLESPEKLGALFREKIMKWFRWIGEPESGSGFWNRVISAGTQKVLSALEILTGPEFMKQISDFFKSIYLSQEQLRDKIEKAELLLKSENTEFTLITTQDKLKVMESSQFAKEIIQRGYHLKRIILNRAWPQDEVGDLSKFSEDEKLEIQNVFNLFLSQKQIESELIKQLPKNIEILRVYDTMKSSNDLKILSEMASDMKESLK